MYTAWTALTVTCLTISWSELPRLILYMYGLHNPMQGVWYLQHAAALCMACTGMALAGLGER